MVICCVRFNFYAPLCKGPGDCGRAGKLSCVHGLDGMSVSQTLHDRPWWCLSSTMVQRPSMHSAQGNPAGKLRRQIWKQRVPYDQNYPDLHRLEDRLPEYELMCGKLVHRRYDQRVRTSLHRCSSGWSLPQFIGSVRLTGLIALLALAGICSGQSFTPIDVSGEVSFSYDRTSTPQGGTPLKGKADFWLKDDAVLAKVTDSDEVTTVLLVRADGTLIQEIRAGREPKVTFYSQVFLPARISMPFFWANHALLGRAESQDAGARISFVHHAQDPRTDRKREGDLVLDGEGRLRNLFWPDKGRPEFTLSISGWGLAAGQRLPERIDLDLQQVTESVSASWTLRKDQPAPVDSKKYTFEGQLDGLLVEGQSFVPINDCRVSIASCVGQTYTPRTLPLISQIGSAGSESLLEPKRSQGMSPLFYVPIFTGLGAALWLLFRKKPAPKA